MTSILSNSVTTKMLQAARTTQKSILDSLLKAPAKSDSAAPLTSVDTGGTAGPSSLSTPVTLAFKTAVADAIDKAVGNLRAADKETEAAKFEALKTRLEVIEALGDVTRAQQKGVLKLFDLNLGLEPQRNARTNAPAPTPVAPAQPAAGSAPARPTVPVPPTVPATPPAQPTAPVADPTPPERVGRFYLIDTTTDQVIAEVVNGGTVDYDTIKDRYVGLVAEADTTLTDQLKSAALTLDAGARRIENTVPYALFGNNGSDYNQGIRLSGGQTYSMNVDYYSSTGATGTLLDTDKLSFTITHS